MHDADKSGAGQEFGSQMLEAALQTAVGAIVIIDEGGLIRTVNPATQKLFGATFNRLPEAVLVADAESKVVLCNPAVARVFGYAPEEMIGQRTAVLYDTAAEYERIRTMETRRAEQEMLEPVTVRYRRKS